MRIFNRVLSILVALAVIVATVCILLVMVPGVAASSLSPTPWFNTQLTHLGSLTGGAWNRAVGISAAMLFLGLIVLFMDLMPERAYSRREARPVETDRVVTERPIRTEPVTTRNEPADTVVPEPEQPIVTDHETTSYPIEEHGD